LFELVLDKLIWLGNEFVTWYVLSMIIGCRVDFCVRLAS
jgi:hypothetical protein